MEHVILCPVPEHAVQDRIKETVRAICNVPPAVCLRKRGDAGNAHERPACPGRPSLPADKGAAPGIPDMEEDMGLRVQKIPDKPGHLTPCVIHFMHGRQKRRHHVQSVNPDLLVLLSILCLHIPVTDDAIRCSWRCFFQILQHPRCSIAAFFQPEAFRRSQADFPGGCRVR